MAVIDRPLDRGFEPPEENLTVGFWDRPLFAAIPIDREMAAYVALVLLAGLMRFWNLGSRMLHHDESLHAVYSWYLYVGKGYVHDPMMHGPFLFELNALVYFLLGATDATARVAPAFFGTLLVGLPFFIRDRLGRTGAVIAAALLTISPTILYYSRFIRHDIYQIFFFLVLVVATFRYLSEARQRYLFIAAATVSLLFSNKEDTYFLMAILLLFLLTISRTDVVDVLLKGKKAAAPATDLLLLIGSLILPLFAAAPYWFVKSAPASTVNAVFGVTFAALFAIGAVVGLRWNRRVWLWSAVTFWGIFFVLYTTFFSNPNGAITGVFGALRYWIDQQGVARGAQPWYYYLVLLPLYEFLSVGVGIGSAFYWLRHRSVFTSFLMYWCVASLTLWGWASEKMPWMVIEMSLPFILLAAVTIGRLVDRTDWPAFVREKGWLLVLSLSLAVVLAFTLIGMGSPFASPVPVVAQQNFFQWVAMVVAFVGLVWAASYYWTKLGNRTAAKLASLSLIALLVPFTVRAAWQASYYHGDIPVEMLVYTQTAPDVGLVMQQIDNIAYRTGLGKSKLQVVYDSGVSWPFEWYLRDFTSRSFIAEGNPPADAPVILAGFDNNHADQIKQMLGDRYVSQRYRLRWWFPEDTTYRNWSIPMLIQDLLNPTDRAALWRYLMYRQTPSELGSTDFVMFVRRDLAYGPWSAPQAQTISPEAQLYQKVARVVPARSVIGSAGAANGQLRTPKGVAVAPTGETYVADAGNNRIEEFGPSGQFVRAWGTKGTGNGQFNEPWGVAVAPGGNVYVADTWNHRVQEFTRDGQFVRAWGSSDGKPASGDGMFFGPRAIAFDPQGNLWVTDTGNKRLEEFDQNGRYLAQFGQAGSGLGQFNEPVGLAIDHAGNFYVADAWNQRIQKLAPDLRPITAWSVAGWEDHSVLDKPYLALDTAGNVWVTDPANNRVLEFGPNGQILLNLGHAGTDASSFQFPTGIALDAAGNVYVTDSENNRVLVFSAIR